VLAIFLLSVVLTGLIPHYWIPSEYRLYLWLLAGLNILVALALFWRMPSRRAGWRPGNAATKRARSWSAWRRGS
jgi:hypothetical protein